MFSGQGSQYYQMGKELYQKHPRFKLWMDHCDEIVRPQIGRSLMEVIYHDEHSISEPFDQLIYTNPALLSIEYSLARILMEMKITPDFLLGYSLGEITASIISGAVSLNDGLELVIEYAKLINRNQTQRAGMLSVFDSVDLMERYPEYFNGCSFTGKNFPGNFVVCGNIDRIERLQAELNKKQIVSQQLAVNYAFHTQKMDVFESDFKQLALNINFASVRTPIISASFCQEIDEVSEEFLWQVVRQPVEFESTIQSLVNRGDYIFIDVGPSGSLSTFVKYIKPKENQSSHLEMINQFGQNLKSLEKLKLQSEQLLLVS